MERQQIKLVDNQFAHGRSFGTGDLLIPPVNFDWYRGSENINDLVVFSEDMFSKVDEYSEKIKVGFIIESPLSNNKPYAYIAEPEHYNKFDMILTFNNDLIKINPDKFKFFPFGGCWIFPEERAIHTKTKNISIVASAKRVTAGHQLRHTVIDNFRPHIEGIFGGGYQFVHNKIEALKDFRYSIIIENDNCDAMFSEKLIDCFITGTIPIYWGCRGTIGNYFNADGIFQFTEIEELQAIIEQCTEANYIKNIAAIQENFETAKKYVIPEDCMWNDYFKDLLNKKA